MKLKLSRKAWRNLFLTLGLFTLVITVLIVAGGFGKAKNIADANDPCFFSFELHNNAGEASHSCDDTTHSYSVTFSNAHLLWKDPTETGQAIPNPANYYYCGANGVGQLLIYDVKIGATTVGTVSIDPDMNNPGSAYQVIGGGYTVSGVVQTAYSGATDSGDRGNCMHGSNPRGVDFAVGRPTVSSSGGGATTTTTLAGGQGGQGGQQQNNIGNNGTTVTTVPIGGAQSNNNPTTNPLFLGLYALIVIFFAAGFYLEYAKPKGASA